MNHNEGDAVVVRLVPQDHKYELEITNITDEVLTDVELLSVWLDRHVQNDTMIKFERVEQLMPDDPKIVGHTTMLGKDVHPDAPLEWTEDSGENDMLFLLTDNYSKGISYELNISFGNHKPQTVRLGAGSNL